MILRLLISLSAITTLVLWQSEFLCLNVCIIQFILSLSSLTNLHACKNHFTLTIGIFCQHQVSWYSNLQQFIGSINKNNLRVWFERLHHLCSLNKQSFKILLFITKYIYIRACKVYFCISKEGIIVQYKLLLYLTICKLVLNKASAQIDNAYYSDYMVVLLFPTQYFIVCNNLIIPKFTVV